MSENKSVERAKGRTAWILVIVMSILTVSAWGYALNPSFNTVIQPGSMVVGASNIAFTDGIGNYFLRNGNDGTITTSNTNATTVLLAAVAATPISGLLFVKAGTYSITMTIAITKPMILEGEGTLKQPGTYFQGSGIANPVIQISYASPQSQGFVLRNLVITPKAGGNGIQFYASSTTTPINGIVENVLVFSTSLVGTGAAFQCTGCEEIMFINDFASNSYYGFLFTQNAGPTFLPNFNKIIGGKCQLANTCIDIADGGTGNVISGMDISFNTIGILLSNANATRIENNWYEVNTGKDIDFGSNTIDTIIIGNIFQCATGVTCVYDGGTRTQILYNQFSGQSGTTGTFFAMHSSSNMSYLKGNTRVNPLGKQASPMSTTKLTMGLCVVSCTNNPAANKTYIISGGDFFLNSTGGSGVSITITDGTGNTVASGMSTLNGWYIPWGFKITFGAFSGAPTVTAYGE